MNAKRLKKITKVKELLKGEDIDEFSPPQTFVTDANGIDKNTGLPLVLPPLKPGQWPHIVIKVIDN